MGLALQMPAEQDQSYRVDENGAFIHGQINIGADGMVINNGSVASAMQLSSEEAEELKMLRKDTKLEDLEVSNGRRDSTRVEGGHDA
jgi:hypothetical protein